MTPQEVFDLTKAIAQDFGLADHVNGYPGIQRNIESMHPSCWVWL